MYSSSFCRAHGVAGNVGASSDTKSWREFWFPLEEALTVCLRIGRVWGTFVSMMFGTASVAGEMSCKNIYRDAWVDSDVTKSFSYLQFSPTCRCSILCRSRRDHRWLLPERLQHSDSVRWSRTILSASLILLVRRTADETRRTLSWRKGRFRTREDPRTSRFGNPWLSSRLLCPLPSPWRARTRGQAVWSRCNLLVSPVPRDPCEADGSGARGGRKIEPGTSLCTERLPMHARAEGCVRQCMAHWRSCPWCSWGRRDKSSGQARRCRNRGRGRDLCWVHWWWSSAWLDPQTRWSTRWRKRWSPLCIETEAIKATVCCREEQSERERQRETESERVKVEKVTRSLGSAARRTRLPVLAEGRSDKEWHEARFLHQFFSIHFPQR